MFRLGVARFVALAIALAMVFGVFAGAASAKKISKKQKAAISKSLRKQIKKNPRVMKRRSFLKKAALVNFKLPVTIRIRGDCPPGAGAASCPAGRVNTGLNERSQYSVNVDLGPSLGQRTVAVGGSLAAEVQFRDSYDGGALGNVSIEILPSNTKTLSTNSVPLLWNPDVDSLSSRVDANFARAAIQSGQPEGAALLAAGWENKLQGCKDFKNETAVSARTFLTAGAAGSYSALWYGSALSGPNGGIAGYPVIDPAGPGTTLAPSYYLPLFPGIEAVDKLKTGVTFNTPVEDPDEYLGPQSNPFPYPAIDPDPSPGDPAIAGNASDTVLRTNALNLAIATAGTQVDLATGTPIAPNTFPTAQGSQNVIVGKSGGEANLFGNIPGKGYGIDVTVSLATKINSAIRIQDHDTFDMPLVAGSQYPAGIFNCGQVWSGAVQNYIPGIRLTGDLRISPAITKDGKLRIAKASVDTSEPTHIALSACLMPYSPYHQEPAAPAYPTTTGAGGPGSTPAIPTYAEAVGGTPGLATTAPYNVLPYDSDQLPYEPIRSATPDTVPCNSIARPLVRDSSLYGSVEPQIAASAANGYTTTNSGAQASVAGDISVSDLRVDVLIGDN